MHYIPFECAASPPPEVYSWGSFSLFWHFSFLSQEWEICSCNLRVNSWWLPKQQILTFFAGKTFWHSLQAKLTWKNDGKLPKWQSPEAALKIASPMSCCRYKFEKWQNKMHLFPPTLEISFQNALGGGGRNRDYHELLFYCNFLKYCIKKLLNHQLVQMQNAHV